MNIYDRDGIVLYTSDKETIKDVLEDAVRDGADLRGADLCSVSGLTAHTPYQIQGSRHGITHVVLGRAMIGCLDLPLAEWLAEYRKIGKQYKYTKQQISEYGSYLRLLAKADEEK